MRDFDKNEWQKRLGALNSNYRVLDDGNVIKSLFSPQGEEKKINLGALALVTAKVVNIDTGVYQYEVSIYSDDKIVKHLFGSEIFNKFRLAELQKYGGMIHTASGDAVVTLLEQSSNVAETRYVTDKVGWMDTPFTDTPIYMADKAYLVPEDLEISNNTERYDLQPKGSWDVVHDLLVEICGNSHLMAILAVSVASILMPLAIKQNLLSIKGWLVSIVGASSSGKTSSTVFSASALGSAGVNKGSLVSSWNGTAASYTARLANVNGLMFLFDEAATLSSKTLDSFVFDLAAGIERARVRVNGELRSPRSWSSIVLSTSETSLLPLLPAQQGTLVRTLELGGSFTESSQQAERLTAAAMNNHGWAIPRLMKYISDLGFEAFNTEMVQRFNRQRDRIIPDLGNTKLAPRLAANIALIVTAAEYMVKILDLPSLDVDGIKSYLVGEMQSQLATFEEEADIQTVIEQWVLYNHASIGLINKQQSIIPKQPIGYVFNPKKLKDSDEFFEISILTSALKSQLTAEGVKQIGAQLKKFKEDGFVISNESDRLSTRKSVNGSKQPYYVLRFSKENLQYFPKLKRILDPDNSIDNDSKMKLYASPAPTFAKPLMERQKEEVFKMLEALDDSDVVG